MRAPFVPFLTLSIIVIVRDRSFRFPGTFRHLIGLSHTRPHFPNVISPFSFSLFSPPVIPPLFCSTLKEKSLLVPQILSHVHCWYLPLIYGLTDFGPCACQFLLIVSFCVNFPFWQRTYNKYFMSHEVTVYFHLVCVPLKIFCKIYATLFFACNRGLSCCQYATMHYCIISLSSHR